MHRLNHDYLTKNQLRALDFAAQRHAGQMYGDKPYIYHLSDVFLVSKEFGAHHDVQVAALLHDVLEDTPTEMNELRILFGPFVTRIVWRVTDEAGDTRAERKEGTLEKTASMAESRELKLYDRIANVRQGGKIDMYRQEHQQFSDYLRQPNENMRAWFELDKLLEL